MDSIGMASDQVDDEYSRMVDPNHDIGSSSEMNNINDHNVNEEMMKKRENARTIQKQLLEQIKEEHARQVKKTNCFRFGNIYSLPKLNLTLHRELTKHQGKVFNIAWSRDSSKLISISKDQHLIVWDVKKSTIETNINFMYSPFKMGCDISPSSKLVACGGLDNLWLVYDISSKIDKTPQDHVPKIILEGSLGWSSSCKFLSDQNLVTASSDSLARLWDIPTGKVICTFIGHSVEVMCVSIPKNENCIMGQVLATGSCDPNAKLWDLKSGTCIQTFPHLMDVDDVQFFPNDQFIVTASSDGVCRLFDLRFPSRELLQYQNPDENAVCGIRSLSLSASGRVLFCACEDHSVYAWDVLKGTLLEGMEKFAKRKRKDMISAVRVSPNGEYLACSSWNKSIYLLKHE
ncbi:hypothetical protein C9374_009455 [Naegleria lovaniensis]|uniref:Guanine nucleotide-binding protein subunit beta-like protein n=1 Tax=Naegleria lovaniensis TaxID=51637 RepID=A0AA88H1B0_NAELO|nr:uncharacterized protein C9374_009455 [Naegleria lovaniensis]KAG2392878.1 hypothetical protein C9374_009455 [Naegleria lovaniensis]